MSANCRTLYRARVLAGIASTALLAAATAAFAAAPLGSAPIESAAAASVALGESYVTYAGAATALKTEKFAYGEQHVLRIKDGKLAERVVLYTCRDGSAFARKTSSYADELAPSFVLEDASNGMREGIRDGDRPGGSRTVFYRASRADAEKSGPLPRVPGLVADSGFDDFVRSNWQALAAGQSLTMHFLVPSRLDDVGFRVQRLRSDRVDGIPVEVFRLKLSGIFGWFLPGIDVYYGAADHVLLRYVGLSDLRDAALDNMAVNIAFNPNERRPAAPRDFKDAGQARLAPCT
jgi:hypothetical protein